VGLQRRRVGLLRVGRNQRLRTVPLVRTFFSSGNNGLTPAQEFGR
jgi:hypothetical protein